MVADVSTLIRLMNGSSDSNESSSSSSSSKPTAPITRDLLGGCLDSKELDLDLQVPPGWEKRLDLKSGKVYLERSNYPTSTLEHKKQHTTTTSNYQTGTAPVTKLPLNLFEDANLELKLPSSSSPSSSSGDYHSSVCTLEKVKSALERAEKELPTRKRSSSNSSSSSSFLSMASSSSNYSNSSISSTININIDHEDMSSSSNSVAAGCPSCLIYVLISRTNPRCPRCNSIVPILPMKKPRIDLNISM